MAANQTNTSTLEWIKAIGMPVATLLVTVVGGYFLTNLTKAREARESDARLYAQLLTQRESSDALIRKEMFGLVINRFLSSSDGPDMNNKVLQLELLATNFNQSLDLAPLFKDLARSLPDEEASKDSTTADLRERLDVTAANVIFKQVSALARRGFVQEQIVPLGDWEQNFGKPVIDRTVSLSELVPESGQPDETVRFQVEIVGVNFERNEVEVRLRVDFSSDADHGVDRHFWVGRYDFPMLDNTQLAQGLRTSVVMTEFFAPHTDSDGEADSFTKIHLVVFPAASASFKERQDYDDVLVDILRAKARADAARTDEEN